MRVLLQRVHRASVTVEQKVVGEIDQGLLLLAGFGKSDSDDLDQKISVATEKVVNMRVFSNEQGKLDHSVLAIAGDILLVPQFTLYGKSLKGRRPDFTDALAPDMATAAFDQFHQSLAAAMNRPIATGLFGADMDVSLINDGPFTLQLEY